MKWWLLGEIWYEMMTFRGNLVWNNDFKGVNKKWSLHSNFTENSRCQFATFFCCMVLRYSPSRYPCLLVIVWGLLGIIRKKRIIGILLYYSYEPSSIRFMGWESTTDNIVYIIYIWYYMEKPSRNFQPHIINAVCLLVIVWGLLGIIRKKGSLGSYCTIAMNQAVFDGMAKHNRWHCDIILI